MKMKKDRKGCLCVLYNPSNHKLIGRGILGIFAVIFEIKLY